MEIFCSWCGRGHTIAEIVQVTGTYDTFEHVRNPGGSSHAAIILPGISADIICTAGDDDHR